MFCFGYVILECVLGIYLVILSKIIHYFFHRHKLRFTYLYNIKTWLLIHNSYVKSRLVVFTKKKNICILLVVQITMLRIKINVIIFINIYPYAVSTVTNSYKVNRQVVFLSCFIKSIVKTSNPIKYLTTNNIHTK